MNWAEFKAQLDPIKHGATFHVERKTSLLPDGSETEIWYVINDALSPGGDLQAPCLMFAYPKEKK